MDSEDTFLTIEEAVKIIDIALKPDSLNDLQEKIFCRIWKGQTYAEIADNLDYQTDYIKYVSFQLWRALTNVFGEKVTKSNFRSVLRRYRQDLESRKQDDKEIKEDSQQKSHLESNYLAQQAGTSAETHIKIQNCTDWGEVIDVSVFFGRTDELVTLSQWIVQDKCRLAALLGMGGIGKTTLAAKLAEQIQGEFEYLIWRSLSHAPPLLAVLTDINEFLNNESETEIPRTIDAQLSHLLHRFRTHRCLLILDDWEIILRDGDIAGYYRQGYEIYGELLKRVGQERHQSSLLLLSREKPIAQEWLIQLVEILNELHQHQYFHRDIKPSNIMLKPDGKLVLIDFGAVREVTESYLQKQKGNETGTVLISPGYTPAEQAEGHAVPQSDFFALGRSFVYLLTGKSPLDFPKDPQTGELIWRNYATQVSPELADLIDRLIAPFPGQRSQNCQEILEYLGKSPQNSLLSKLVATIPGLSHLDINHKITKKRQPLQRKLQWLLASLLLLAGFNLWKSAPDIADHLSELGFDSSQEKKLINAEIYYRLALIFDPKMPEPSYNLGLLYEDQQKFNQAEAAYKIAVEQDWGEAYNNLARLYILQKQSLKAVVLLEKGLPLVFEDKTKYAMLKNLGWAKMELGRYQEAQTYINQAISITNISNTRPSAYCLNAQLLELQQLKQQALPDWQKCFDLEPKTPEEHKWKTQAQKVLANLQPTSKFENTGIK